MDLRRAISPPRRLLINYQHIFNISDQHLRGLYLQSFKLRDRNIKFKLASCNFELDIYFIIPKYTTLARDIRSRQIFQRYFKKNFTFYKYKRIKFIRIRIFFIHLVLPYSILYVVIDIFIDFAVFLVLVSRFNRLYNIFPVFRDSQFSTRCSKLFAYCITFIIKNT